MTLRADDFGLHEAVRKSFILPRGTGAARAVVRSLKRGTSELTCASLASLEDPLVGGLCQPNEGLATAGARLQRHEASATVAKIRVSRADCLDTPLALTYTISPSLLFISAFGSDPRNVSFPVEAGDVLIAPEVFSGDVRVTTGVRDSLRGIVARVTTVEWKVSGVPSAAAIALNASYSGKLPSVHTLSWTSAALGSGIPPYALLPGYHYTATASVTLQAAWAFNTGAFTGVFPPAPPPSSAYVVPPEVESLRIESDFPWALSSSRLLQLHLTL